MPLAMTAEQFMRLVTIGATFALVLALWLMGVIVWASRRARRQRILQDRMDMLEGGSQEATRTLQLWHEGEKATLRVPGARRDRGPLARLERMRQDAGIESPLPTLVLGTAGMAGLGFVTGYAVSGRVLAGAMVAATVLIVFGAYIRRRISKRQRLFEGQLLDALELSARSLRVGHPLMGAFQMISEEVPPPVGRAFAEICQQQQLGMPLAESVQQAADRSGSSDMRIFATSVQIQLRSGGNLADMMERLSMVIRERIRLNRRVRVMIAQTQFSKWVLVALPFVLFTALNLISPVYMEPLHTTTLGQIMLAAGGVSLLLGVWVMNRMTRQRV